MNVSKQAAVKARRGTLDLHQADGAIPTVVSTSHAAYLGKWDVAAAAGGRRGPSPAPAHAPKRETPRPRSSKKPSDKGSPIFDRTAHIEGVSSLKTEFKPLPSGTRESMKKPCSLVPDSARFEGVSTSKSDFVAKESRGRRTPSIQGRADHIVLSDGRASSLAVRMQTSKQRDFKGAAGPVRHMKNDRVGHIVLQDGSVPAKSESTQRTSYTGYSGGPGRRTPATSARVDHIHLGDGVTQTLSSTQRDSYQAYEGVEPRKPCVSARVDHISMADPNAATYGRRLSIAQTTF